MFLSLFYLKFSECRKLKIKNDYDIHQFIYKLFPNQEKRCFLYYVDYSSKEKLKILIQSEMRPEILDYGQIIIKEVSDSWFEADAFMFRIRMATVIRNEGKYIDVVDDVDIENWIIQKAGNNGFSILKDSVQVVYSGEMRMKQSNGNRVVMPFKDIVGVLRVTDQMTFIEKAVKRGIGQGKGFGCGLLQLQRINKEAFI